MENLNPPDLGLDGGSVHTVTGINKGLWGQANAVVSPVCLVLSAYGKPHAHSEHHRRGHMYTVSTTFRRLLV